MWEEIGLTQRYRAHSRIVLSYFNSRQAAPPAVHADNNGTCSNLFACRLVKNTTYSVHWSELCHVTFWQNRLSHKDHAHLTLKCLNSVLFYFLK